MRPWRPVRTGSGWSWTTFALRWCAMLRWSDQSQIRARSRGQTALRPVKSSRAGVKRQPIEQGQFRPALELRRKKTTPFSVSAFKSPTRGQGNGPSAGRAGAVSGLVPGYDPARF